MHDFFSQNATNSSKKSSNYSHSFLCEVSTIKTTSLRHLHIQLTTVIPFIQPQIERYCRIVHQPKLKLNAMNILILVKLSKHNLLHLHIHILLLFNQLKHIRIQHLNILFYFILPNFTIKFNALNSHYHNLNQNQISTLVPIHSWHDYDIPLYSFYLQFFFLPHISMPLHAHPTLP